MERPVAVFIAVCASLAASVRAAEPLIPNDPDFPMQWALQNFGQEVNDKLGLAGADIAATSAWGLHTGGSPVVVAIVTTGVNPHPEFADRLLPGYVTSLAGGDPFSTLDTHGQGTRLAGIIAADMNNGVGIAGLNPHAHILPVRAANGSASSTQSAAEGIEWAVEAGADIVLVALQFPVGSEELAAAIAFAQAAGVLVIAPAGHTHTNEVYYPAAYAECLAVSGTTSSDLLASASNHGPQVGLSAPAEDVWSTLRNGDYGFAGAAESAAAAAHVAGAASLIRSFAPLITAAQIRTLLQDSADDLGPPGHDTQFGHGRLNVGAALAMTAVPTLRFELLDSLPDVLPANLPTTATIRIADGTHAVLPSSPLTIYRTIPGGVQPSIPLRWLGGDMYAVDFPALPCGTAMEYYLSATATNQFTIFEPSAAPTAVRSVRVRDRVLLFHDDFETDRGWAVFAEGEATTGLWTRVEPTGTIRDHVQVQPEYDRTANEKQLCFITGQHPGGNAQFNVNNVNVGPVRLTSPVIDLFTADAEVSFAAWVYSTSGEIDFLEVEFSRDGGISWLPAESIGPTSGWVSHSFRLQEKSSQQGDRLVLRFSIADVDNASLTEAGVDDVIVASVACTASGDLDNNGKVDKYDWPVLWAYMLGPLSPISHGCHEAELNGDARIDMRDAAAFCRLSLGP